MILVTILIVENALALILGLRYGARVWELEEGLPTQPAVKKSPDAGEIKSLKARQEALEAEIRRKEEIIDQMKANIEKSNEVAGEISRMEGALGEAREKAQEARVEAERHRKEAALTQERLETARLEAERAGGEAAELRQECSAIHEELEAAQKQVERLKKEIGQARVTAPEPAPVPEPEPVPEPAPVSAEEEAALERLENELVQRQAAFEKLSARLEDSVRHLQRITAEEKTSLDLLAKLEGSL
ncbi:MAG: hypothetical protein HQL11_03160 [Candidatus Omnitrophica bacterium]|nr:hypothetical protein [Candidatus Omnitrophota bacterium]